LKFLPYFSHFRSLLAAAVASAAAAIPYFFFVFSIGEEVSWNKITYAKMYR
jgi:hypothetical protein